MKDNTKQETPSPAKERAIDAVAMLLRDLFTNGGGSKADRLVLWRDSDNQNLGGWGKAPISDKLVDFYNDAFKAGYDAALASPVSGEAVGAAERLKGRLDVGVLASPEITEDIRILIAAALQHTSAQPPWVYVADCLPDKEDHYEVSTTGSPEEMHLRQQGVRVPYVDRDFYNAALRKFDDSYVYAWRPIPQPAPYQAPQGGTGE